jgi:hypothetical protein
MKTNKKLKKITRYKGVDLVETRTKIKVHATEHQTWSVLSQYGNVSTFHAAVELSVAKGDDRAYLGNQRTCIIMDGKREIMMVEKIIEFKEGAFYRYEVCKSKNFPIEIMLYAFSLEKGIHKNTTLSIIQNYKLNPAFLTHLLYGKIKEKQQEILMGYKNYIETGAKNVPITLLKQKEYQFE